MLSPDQPVFPFKHEWASGPESSSGIDLRTWMATQFLSAFITHKGFDGMRLEREAVQTADRLITELNKPKP